MNVQTIITRTVFWTNSVMSISRYNLVMIKRYQTEHKLIKIKMFCTAQTAEKLNIKLSLNKQQQQKFLYGCDTHTHTAETFLRSDIPMC